MFKNFKHRAKIVSAIVVLAELFSPFLATPAAHAAIPPFAYMYLRFNRMQALTQTGGTLCATTPGSGVGTETSVKILFPTVAAGTDFVVNATAANWTVTTTNLPTGAVAWPGIGTATNVTGKTVTFPSTALSPSTQYCFNFSGLNTLTNSDAGNSYKLYVDTYNASNAIVMETEIGVSVVDGVIKFDRYTVNATVPPIFIFFLEASIDLDPAVVSATGGIKFDITTNAKGGWIAWVKDSQQGLYSPTANYTIATTGTVDGLPSVLASNSEGYVLASQVITDAAGGCTVAPDPEYDFTNGVPAGNQSKAGGTLSANFQPVASCTGVPPATSNGDQVQLSERASIAGGTPAGSDYADIITVVAAGNF
jgi:hypothetical protein